MDRVLKSLQFLLKPWPTWGAILDKINVSSMASCNIVIDEGWDNPWRSYLGSLGICRRSPRMLIA